MGRPWIVAVLVAMLLVACGSPSPTPTPTPEPTATPSPTPEPTPEPTPSPAGLAPSASARAYLSRIVGYEVVALPEALEQEMATEMAAGMAGDPMVGDILHGYAVASLTAADGAGAAIALVFELDPAWGALPGFLEGIAEGAIASGDEAVAVTVAGRPAYQIETVDGSFVVYEQSDFLVMVVGADAASTTPVAEALINGNT